MHIHSVIISSLPRMMLEMVVGEEKKQYFQCQPKLVTQLFLSRGLECVTTFNLKTNHNKNKYNATATAHWTDLFPLWESQDTKASPLRQSNHPSCDVPQKVIPTAADNCSSVRKASENFMLIWQQLLIPLFWCKENLEFYQMSSFIYLEIQKKNHLIAGKYYSCDIIKGTVLTYLMKVTWNNFHCDLVQCGKNVFIIYLLWLH